MCHRNPTGILTGIRKHDTAKALLIWYAGRWSQMWTELDWTFVENVAVPVDQLADTPDEM